MILMFLLFPVFLYARDKKSFDHSDWLYFISHYQFFYIGVLTLAFSIFSLMIGFIYSIFELNSNFFIIACLIFSLLFPYSLDSIYYGLFGFSFFLEKFFYKNHNLLGEKRTSFYRFIHLYIRFINFLISSFFFIFFYFLLILFYSLICWIFLNFNQMKSFLFEILNNTIFIYFILIFFFLTPFLIENFFYSIKNKSYFNEK